MVDALDMARSNETKKRILLFDYKEVMRNSDGCKTGSKTRNLATCHANLWSERMDQDKLRKTRLSSEKFANMLFEIIQDDTTTNKETIELIRRYKSLTPKPMAEQFEQIEQYLLTE